MNCHLLYSQNTISFLKYVDFCLYNRIDINLQWRNNISNMPFSCPCTRAEIGMVTLWDATTEVGGCAKFWPVAKVLLTKSCAGLSFFKTESKIWQLFGPVGQFKIHTFSVPLFTSLKRIEFRLIKKAKTMCYVFWTFWTFLKFQVFGDPNVYVVSCIIRYGSY